MTTRNRTQTEFRRLVHECIADAETLYGLDFGRVTITFDLRGENAAKAYQYPHDNLGYVYKLRFNRDAIRLDWEHMASSTIPHEVAHLVAFALPSLKAENHNHQWRAIAIRLGDVARGHPYHTIPLKPARRLRRFVYENDTGGRVEVTPRLHRQVQEGQCGLVCERQHFSAQHFREMTIAG